MKIYLLFGICMMLITVLLLVWNIYIIYSSNVNKKLRFERKQAKGTVVSANTEETVVLYKNKEHSLEPPVSFTVKVGETVPLTIVKGYSPNGKLVKSTMYISE